MRRRTLLLGIAGLPFAGLGLAAAGTDFAPVRPGRPLVFPADHGAHPDFRTEWWYATGWLTQPDGRPLGFQITFFRVRTGLGEQNPSAFAPRQLILAHAAIADPGLGRLRHDQRAGRVGLGRAGFETERTQAWIDDWRFEQHGDGYRARVQGEGFAYDLTLIPDGPLMLNGAGGFSTKAPDPRHASYYYSRPQLQASGHLTLDGVSRPVTGRAWLDHEWSSDYLPEGAAGWDWTGLNVDDGGALMAFQMRGTDGRTLWSAATVQPSAGEPRVLGPREIDWTPLRRWRSGRTGIEYPVAWRLRLGGREFQLEPLMDDQELDSQRSTGAIYWEGAVRLLEGAPAQREIGRGYLELTGYGGALRVG